MRRRPVASVLGTEARSARGVKNAGVDRDLPSGVVTFVLTDIVGSTTLWEQVPEAMGAALRVHDGIIAAAVVENGGHLIKSRGEGDSTFSVFSRASDAVRAAHAAQLGLAAATWPTPTAIAVRFAIHTGEAPVADDDYTGSTVNRAARIRSVADGGEVLVSSATAGLVADQLPVDVTLVALGEVRLRDLRRPEVIYGLAGPGLPPVRTRARGESAAAVLAGRGVTRREADVLAALADRLTNGEIAVRLSVGERTVETHVSSLLRKLGVSGRAELSTIAKEMAATATPPALPPVIEMLARRSSCVGRQDERAQLLACWERAAGGAMIVAVVTGEAGMGKSRLVAELAIDVDVRGGRVLFGSCSERSEVPYQPFVEALSGVIADTPEIQLRDHVGRKSVALARALPDLADRLGLLMPREVLDVEAERHATQDALHSFLSNVARGHPTLLIVEDVHWASPTTRDAIRRIARTSGHSGLLVLATTRDTAPDVDAHLAQWLADMARLPAAEVVAVVGLDVAAAQAVITEVGGTLDAPTAVRETGGNPLFLREMATARQSSRTLQGFLADRYSLVPETDLDVLDVAVILGQTVHAEVVAAAAERPVHEVIHVLDRAGAAGLVQPLAGSAGRYSFVHALFRSVRYESMPTSQRLRLHAAAARALMPRADDPRVLPELAFHACVAAPLGGAADAVALARRAAEQAARAGDATTAVAHYRAALEAIDHLTPPDQRLRLELSIRLGTELTHIDARRGRESLAAAAEQARELGEAVSFADAVCSMAILGGSMSPGSDDPTFIAYAEDALALLGPEDEAWHIRVLATLGTHVGLGSQPARGREMVREALERARRLGDQYVLTRTLMSAPYVDAARGFDERIAAGRELVELGHAVGSPAITRLACYWLRSAYRQAGDFTQMQHWAEVGRRTGAPPSLNDQ